ncbi:lysosomal dipeptide transporter MFSD1 isoform X5 [Equus caballus]|uniref:lysosomal dipeptide transporter MFSD1 isoform X5 n=1 Tax=Equus caballus TaxID=9796 RepID=UPI0038B30390
MIILLRFRVSLSGWGTIIFSCFVCTGQVVFALGGIFNAFWLMEFGRFVFGIGGESLAVAQNTYAVSWFKGKELNLVFGLQLSMARIALRAVRGDWKLAVMGGPPSPANFVELSLTQR